MFNYTDRLTLSTEVRLEHKGVVRYVSLHSDVIRPPARERDIIGVRNEVCDGRVAGTYSIYINTNTHTCAKIIVIIIIIIIIIIIQRASEASGADYQSCSIEISDIYIYVGMYAYVKKFRPRF